MKRVVVTGMGIVSPLGLGVEHNWSSLLESKSGLGHITHFPEPYNIDDFASKIAGVVPKTKDENPSNGEFNADLFVPPKDQRKMDPFIIYGMAAAEEAIADSGWKPETSSMALKGQIIQLSPPAHLAHTPLEIRHALSP